MNNKKKIFVSIIQNKSILLTCFILITMLSIVSLLIYSNDNSIQKQKPYSYINTSKPEMPIGEIVNNVIVTQSFVAEESQLYGISLQLATYARENTSKQKISLINKNTNKVIETWQVNGKNIQDNMYHDFILKSPLENIKGNSFYIKIVSDDAFNGNAITIWSSNNDSYSDGSLYINGVVQQGDLSFKVFALKNDYRYLIFIFINIILLSVILTYFIFNRQFIKLSLYTLYVIGFGLIIYSIFNDNAKHFYETFTINIKMYYLLIIYISLFFYYGGKSKENMYLIIFTIIIVGVMGIFFDKSFSPIDESAHFDYINKIMESKKIPTLFEYIDGNSLSLASNMSISSNVINHEAVQPPVYYILMAIVSSFFDDYAIRLIMIRCCGIIILILMLVFGVKSIMILKKNNIINCKSDDYLYFIILFMLNPGVVLRFTRVSNESLVALLAIILMYLYIKMLYEGYSKKLLLQCNLLIIMIILTKNTGFFLIGGLFVILIYYKKITKLIQSIIFILIGVSPWLIFNIKTYNALTGIKEHLNYVLPIVNPNQQKLDLVPDTINIFSSYINPQEVPKNNLYLILLTFVSLAIIFIIISFSIYSIKQTYHYLNNKLNFKYDLIEKNNILIIIFTAILVVNICILFMGSISTLVNTMIGRYIYISAIPLICLGCFWIQKKEDYEKKTIYFVISLTISIGYIALFSTVTNVILTNTNFIGSKINYINISEVTDENWINGVSKDGNIILTDGENRGYSRLINRKIRLSDGQKSEIIDIQINAGYTYLLLDSPVVNSGKHSNFEIE